MAIHLLHGCAREWAGGQQIFRNIAPEAALRSYLRARSSPYRAGPPSGPGDILTIDDSTRAAGHAAALARECGHHVRLFVNAHQVETGEPYFFSLLNACLDARREARVSYGGEVYDLGQGIDVFRRAAKAVLSALTPEAACSHVAEIGELLNCSAYALEEHAQTLSRRELLNLVDMGVTIENHGRSHQDIDSLDDDVLRRDVAQTRDWLGAQLNVHAMEYALPFGRTVRHRSMIGELAEIVYLVGPTSSQVGRNVWTRIEITPELCRGAAA